MGISWNKNLVKLIPGSATEPDKYEIEIFQGDTINLLDYVVFEPGGTKNALNTWKKTLVNAAHFTDNGPTDPGDLSQFSDSFYDDSEVTQYASKYALDWNAEIKPIPLSIPSIIIDKFGILETSSAVFRVASEIEVWVNFGKKVPGDLILDPPSDKPTDEIKKLTIKIKSNSFLGEGGLLNGVTGSIDAFVTDSLKYVTSALTGVVGFLGEGVAWGISQVEGLYPSGSKGYNEEDAKQKLEEEKDREASLFSTVIGYPFTALDFLTKKQNASLIKSGLKALSTSAKIYQLYAQGKSAIATGRLLANLRTLLDYEKLSPGLQIKVANFLGTSPKTIKRIIWVVNKIIEIEKMVSDGNYDALQEYVLKEAENVKSLDDLPKELREFATGEAFSELSPGSVVTKKLQIVDKDNLKLIVENPSYRKTEGNNIVLNQIIIKSINKEGDFIPIKSISIGKITSPGFVDGFTANELFYDYNTTRDICTITIPNTYGSETGADPISSGLFPNGSMELKINVDNTKYQQQYEGTNPIRSGVIPFQIDYKFIGNSIPRLVYRKFNAATKVYEEVNEDLPHILDRGEEVTETISYDNVIPGSWAEQNFGQNPITLEQGFDIAKNGLAVYNLYKKKQFLSIFDAVDFKNLPAPVQTFIFSTAALVGIDESEIIRYYEVLSGAKNLYELSTKGFQHYNSLPPELKAKISKQLGVSEDVLGDVIPIAGDITDLISGKRFNGPGEKEKFAEGLFDKVGQSLLNKWGPNAEVWENYNAYDKKTGKVTPGGGTLDPKMKQTIALSLGFTNIKATPTPYKKDPVTGKDVTHTEVNGLAIIKCGIAIDKALKFKNSLAKGISVKNRLLQKYEQVKNSPNLIEDEALLTGVYDELVDTREDFEKEDFFKDIYDSAKELTKDPYADLLDSAGSLPPGVPGSGDPNWRQKYNVEEEYLVEDSTGAPPSGVKGVLQYGTYIIYTHPWIEDIGQNPETGLPVFTGTPPSGFLFKQSDINWVVDGDPNVSESQRKTLGLTKELKYRYAFASGDFNLLEPFRVTKYLRGLARLGVYNSSGGSFNEKYFTPASILIQKIKTGNPNYPTKQQRPIYIGDELVPLEVTNKTTIPGGATFDETGRQINNADAVQVKVVRKAETRITPAGTPLGLEGSKTDGATTSTTKTPLKFGEGGITYTPLPVPTISISLEIS
jgi:hypothetical protein